MHTCKIKISFKTPSCILIFPHKNLNVLGADCHIESQIPESLKNRVFVSPHDRYSSHMTSTRSIKKRTRYNPITETVKHTRQYFERPESCIPNW